jgi:hypothetical protein
VQRYPVDKSADYSHKAHSEKDDTYQVSLHQVSHPMPYCGPIRSAVSVEIVVEGHFGFLVAAYGLEALFAALEYSHALLVASIPHEAQQARRR